MKKLNFIYMVLGMVVFSCNTEKDIPASKVPSLVVNSFETKFPNAIDLEWEKNHENYLAEFENEQTDYFVLLDPDGNIKKYKFEILISDLPNKITAVIETKYPDRLIDEAEVVKANGKTFYQIELEGGWWDIQKIFDENGNEKPEETYWE